MSKQSANFIGIWQIVHYFVYQNHEILEKQ